nr:hypothetical protein [Mycoplasmopsis bovis]
MLFVSYLIEAKFAYEVCEAIAETHSSLASNFLYVALSLGSRAL